MMTKDEAKLFFNVPDEVDAWDYYDEQIFEYKQFFLSKAPIQKVFVAKLDKLIQLDNAYRIWTDLPLENFDLITFREVVFSDQVLDAFQLFEQEKGVFKLKLMQAGDAKGVVLAVRCYLDIVKRYRIKWLIELESNTEFEGTISKEVDPMELLAEIRRFQLEGGKEFKDITKIGSNSFLLNEMKRVSLLYKNYGG